MATEAYDDLTVDSVASPPSRADIVWDRSFRFLTYLLSFLAFCLLCWILYTIGGTAKPAIAQYGSGFLTSKTWDPNSGEFGILPQIWGTLYSSILALLLAAFFGVAIAVFLTQDFLPSKLEVFFKNVIELLAAIPSVVYGLWGIFIVIPAIRPLADWIHERFDWIPFFETSLSGPGLFPAALVLAIMILPTVSAISRDALTAVPRKLVEASFGLGATHWETIFRVILPTAASGIFGALVLGFGRALGETMALAMLVGNANRVSLSIFSPANTLAALLANNFPEASKTEEGALMFAALVLMLITLLVNMLGTWIMNQASKRMRGSA